MVFPRPRTENYFPGQYSLREIYTDCDPLTFYKRIKSGNQDITVASAPFLAQEEYTLTVDADGIRITAACDEGIYRAATSLLQLIQDGCVPYAQIADKPELKRRGYMLDISRAKMPTMESLKALVDFLSGLKYNELQLYFEGMCFDYSAFPAYTADFICLTPEDIRELDAYCAQRFMDLVPNQNSFGHLAPWLERPEFRHLGLSDGQELPNTINPLLEESYEFIGKLYESVLPHFRSKYVNIGLDEAYGLGKYQIEEHCAKYGKDRVFMDWLNRLSALTTGKYGKSVMFWADMIYHYQNLYHEIPRDAIALEWGYELIQSQMMTEHCITFRDAGIRYYVCPSTNTHLAFTGRFDVTSFNIRTSAELAVRFGAEGILLTDWGSGGHPQFGVWSLVPIALCGQYGWNTGAQQNGETFKADFIHAAEKYVDRRFFDGKPVSRLLYRLANYYLLEPERVHVGTMCGELFLLPLKETKYAYFYDLKECGDVFYFDNIIRYVTQVLSDVEALEFDPLIKAEIRTNAEMVILSSELCKLRMRAPLTEEHRASILAQMDKLEEAYPILWDTRNFPRGKEQFLQQLQMHREAVIAYPAESSG